MSHILLCQRRRGGHRRGNDVGRQARRLREERAVLRLERGKQRVRVGDFVAVKRAFVGVEGKQQQVQRVRICPGALQGSAKIRMARLLVLFRLHLLPIGIKLPAQRRQFLAGAVTGLARLVARLCHFGKRRPDAFELRRLAACGIALLPKRVDGFRVSGNDAFRRIRRNLQFL